MKRAEMLALAERYQSSADWLADGKLPEPGKTVGAQDFADTAAILRKIAEPVADRLDAAPFVQASVDPASGLHELWLVARDANGCVVPIAGPERWPDKWIDLRAKYLADALSAPPRVKEEGS